MKKIILSLKSQVVIELLPSISRFKKKTIFIFLIHQLFFLWPHKQNLDHDQAATNRNFLPQNRGLSESGKK